MSQEGDFPQNVRPSSPDSAFSEEEERAAAAELARFDGRKDIVIVPPGVSAERALVASDLPHAWGKYRC